MNPDLIHIGDHAYALTLNLFVTGSIGLFFTFLAFYWKRKVAKDDAEKKALITAREQLEGIRHEELRGSIDSNHDVIITKLDDMCKRFDIVDKRFHNHEHLIVIDGRVYKSEGKITGKDGQ